MGSPTPLQIDHHDETRKESSLLSISDESDYFASYIEVSEPTATVHQPKDLSVNDYEQQFDEIVSGRSSDQSCSEITDGKNSFSLPPAKISLFALRIMSRN